MYILQITGFVHLLKWFENTVDATLYGIEPDLSKIISYCEEEEKDKPERKIDFVA